MSSLIYYPHLYLFAYNLENHRGQNITEIGSDASWECLRDKLQIPPQATNDFQEYCFPQDNTEEFAGNIPIAGYYRCTLLHDTNGLLVLCSAQDEINPQNVSCFYHFRQKLEVKSDIGKTWIIAGYSNLSSQEEHEMIAKDAYKAVSSSSLTPQPPRIMDIPSFLLFCQTERNPASVSAEENTLTPS